MTDLFSQPAIYENHTNLSTPEKERLQKSMTSVMEMAKESIVK